jgi:CelD/BcsL family acetyltransferase involved in cellulose biosynthesis
VAVASTSGPWKILATDSVELIQRDWDFLVKSGRATPFQTPAWLHPWYRIVAPHIGARPLFIVVRNAASDAPLMMLPLCTRRQRMLRIIEFADGGLSDYNAPLLARDFVPGESEMAKLWQSILKALPAADVVRLNKMPAAFAGGPNPLDHTHAMSIESWRIQLPSSRVDYDKRLTSTFLKELRRKGRRVDGRGKSALVHAADSDHALKIFDALARMRTHRFEELGRDNVLAVPALRSFYEAVIVENWSQGFTALSALEVEGEIAATLFALKHDNTYYLLLSAFRNGEWKSASPGNVMLDRMATHLIETGVGTFDFTIGNESYKSDFGAEPQPLLAGDYPRSLLGWPVALRRALSHRVGNGLRSPAVVRATSLAKRFLRINS